MFSTPPKRSHSALACKRRRNMPVDQGLRDFLEDESGAEFVEWAVVTLILLAVTVPVLIAIGDELARIFNDILGQLERIPEG